jgi:Protein of unknown function, DUF547
MQRLKLNFQLLLLAGFMALVAGLSQLVPAANAGGPESQLWERWSGHDEESRVRVDHHIWNRLLETYVATSDAGVNRFDYAAVSPADRRALVRYLDLMSEIDVAALNRNEQLAFWANCYNAIVTKLILEAYPVGSFLDIGGDLFSKGPWKDKHFKVYGEALSLHDIENRIIRPIWQDLRTLYLLSCGALGCPNIGAQAFHGYNIDGRMEAAATEFINGPQAIHFIDGTSVRLSSYYDWYFEDFENQHKTILQHLRDYATGELAGQLEAVGHITGFDFDWTLNDIDRPA